MSEIIVARRLSHKQAQKELSHWIRLQKWWDSLLFKSTGKRVYPQPHEVYHVERQGKKYAVVFDDPTM